jgi:hypothetical protein
VKIPLERIAAELLKDVEEGKTPKTPECLSVDTLGAYVEYTLPGEERDKVESHVGSCLYCLNELVELRELIFLEKNAELMPPRPVKRDPEKLAGYRVLGNLYETFRERVGSFKEWIFSRRSADGREVYGLAEKALVSNIINSAKKTLDKLDLDSVKQFTEEIWLKTANLAGDKVDFFRNALKSMDKDKMEEIIINTWVHLKETPNNAILMWGKMDKSAKLAAIALMAGGAVVSVPFMIAAGPLSIVSALAVLGGGAIAAGGLGVAGGIIVTATGATLSSVLAVYIANKVIQDPDVEKLVSAYAELEKVIKQNFIILEKNQAQYRDLYRRYGEIANFVAELINKTEKKSGHDSEAVKEFSMKIDILLEDFNRNLQDE